MAFAVDPAVKSQYELVIGLEVHAQLSTRSKIFAPDLSEYGSLPNTNVSVITLAHPGTLPKLNKKAVEYAIRIGLACGSEINRYTHFARKNYFYPDLPKGYQITQDKTPLCVGGSIFIKVNGTEKEIKLFRIHLEEDAGKSMHLAGETDTLVDFNRAGTPLIEIVSQPDLRSAEDAYEYLTEVRKLVRYLDICDGNMEEGSLRCDVNVSVRKRGETRFGTRVEIKNMNSMRNVQRAIEYEYERQVAIIEAGGSIQQETLNFDAVTGETSSMRRKETMNDYRYFPEPDLTPLRVSQEWLKEIESALPPLPRQLYQRFVQTYQLPEYDAMVLTDAKELALYFEEICQHTHNYKAAANWMMGPVKSYLNERTLHLSEFPLSPRHIADIIALIEAGKISYATANQKLFLLMLERPDLSAGELAERENLIQESDTHAIQSIVKEVLDAMPTEVEKYKKGVKNIVGVFVGQVMKKSNGKANPQLANQLIVKMLEEMPA
jgi:aspartyl-tRNA(Asn)/glutamyl-tRNA(Gln) amidotransferase subunit B